MTEAVQCPEFATTIFVDQPPSCLEFCPDLPDHFMVGTYLLSETKLEGEEVQQTKTGSVQLWKLDPVTNELYVKTTSALDRRIDNGPDLQFKDWRCHMQFSTFTSTRKIEASLPLPVALGASLCSMSPTALDNQVLNNYGQSKSTRTTPFQHSFSPGLRRIGSHRQKAMASQSHFPTAAQQSSGLTATCRR